MESPGSGCVKRYKALRMYICFEMTRLLTVVRNVTKHQPSTARDGHSITSKHSRQHDDSVCHDKLVYLSGLEGVKASPL